MYVYIYIYIHTQVYIYIYTHISRCAEQEIHLARPNPLWVDIGCPL